MAPLTRGRLRGSCVAKPTRRSKPKGPKAPSHGKHNTTKANETPSSGEDVQQLDLIQLLNNRRMHEVVEQIFSYLDYNSAVNAEKVSEEWQTILSNERIWKALLERNLASDPVWRKFYDWIKPPGGVPDSAAVSPRSTCKQIGDLQHQILDLMTSSMSLVSSSMKMLWKLIEMVKLMGSNYSALIAKGGIVDDI